MVEAQRVGSLQERAELDELVAPHAWIRSPSCTVLVEEVFEHRPLERLRHVHHPKLEPSPLGHRRGVGLGPWPAAAVVHPVQVHQLHVLPHDAVAALVKERGRHRGIDSAAHGDQDGRHAAHAFEASIRPPSRWEETAVWFPITP
jgi:hypothetical protein